MFRYFYAGAAAVLFLLLQANWALNAQTPLLNELKATIGKTVGAEAGSIEFVVNQDILTVLRVNSNMNQSTHAGRDNEANLIGLVVSKAISGSAEYKNLHTIRIQYVARATPGTQVNVVDTIDFRKPPSGAFEFHNT